jgi:hypothetical protein
VRIIEEEPDLPPDRTTSHAAVSYVRAVLALRPLRGEIVQKLLEVERCGKKITSRLQAEVLLAEAQQSMLTNTGTGVASLKRPR